MRWLISVCLMTVACASSPPSATVDKAAPLSFRLPDAKGDEVSLSDFHGRPVILDFWASWCEPCKTAMPFFDELQAKYSGRLVVIGVSVDDSADKMRAALAERPVRFLILHDEKGELARQLNVETMPSTYVVDGEGRIQAVHRGFVVSDKTSIEAEVAKLVAESPPS